MSSGRGRNFRLVVLPGLLFAVGGPGLETAVQDAYESVRELPQRGVVPDVAAPKGVVVSPGTGRGPEGGEGLKVQRGSQPTLPA